MLQIQNDMDTGSLISKNISKGNFAQWLSSMGLLIVIIIFCIVLSVMSPVFLTPANILNLLIQSTILGTISIGATFVIITGGIDLSVGSVLSVASCIGLGVIVKSGMPVIIGIVVMIAIGIAFGLANGVLVSLFNIPAMIVTLATMGIGRGVVLIYTNGANITPVPKSFTIFSEAKFMGIPAIIFLVAGFAIVWGVILAFSVFGRSIYATGGNELAARLAGIRTKSVVTSAYIICGVMAALGGLLMTVRLQSAGPITGEGIEMNVIAAVVIGGTSLFGGRGNIIGTVMGVLIISLVSNAVNLLGVPPAWDQLVKGAVILVAALLDVFRSRMGAGLQKVTK